MKKHNKRIKKLQGRLQPIAPQDAIAEAGRKVLLDDFVAMLKREPGSRLGEDPEEVHDMRVAIRRMRTLFRILAPYYKPKDIAAHQEFLRNTARALGAVRDLDVMIADLERFRASLPPEQQTDFQTLIDSRLAQNVVARRKLIKFLDSKAYRRFVKEYSKFVATPGLAAKKPPKGVITPVELRHVLPVLLQERLAAVRAYDSDVGNGDITTLHALRIDGKQLRYTVSFFQGILDDSLTAYIEAIKTLQDHLGRLNDIEVAQAHLGAILADAQDAPYAATVQGYIDSLETEKGDLVDGFPAVWTQFNTRKVQQILANALLKLR